MKNKVLLGNILAFLTIIMWDFTYIGLVQKIGHKVKTNMLKYLYN